MTDSGGWPSPRAQTSLEKTLLLLRPGTRPWIVLKSSARLSSLWNVSGAVIDVSFKWSTTIECDTFETQRIIDEQLLRFKHVIGRDPHPFMRRDFVSSHGGLETMWDRHETKPAILPLYYHSRAPGSDSMHLGHIVHFTVTKPLLLP